MCWQTETYHIPCGHWSQPRVETRCDWATMKDLHSGCHNNQVIGTARVDEWCKACQYRSSIELPQDMITHRVLSGDIDKVGKLTSEAIEKKPLTSKHQREMELKSARNQNARRIDGKLEETRNVGCWFWRCENGSPILRTSSIGFSGRYFTSLLFFEVIL